MPGGGLAVSAGHIYWAIDFPATSKGRTNRASSESSSGPTVGFHTLRHTCASLLFERDANPVQVCKILGHANPGVTLGLYTHFIRSELPAPLDLAAELAEEERTTNGQPAASAPVHDPVAELAI